MQFNKYIPGTKYMTSRQPVMWEFLLILLPVVPTITITININNSILLPVVPTITITINISNSILLPYFPADPH